MTSISRASGFDHEAEPDMRQISLAYIFNVASELDVIESIPNFDEQGNVMLSIHRVESALSQFIEKGDFLGHFRSSYMVGTNLLAESRRIIREFDVEEPEKKIYLVPLKLQYGNYKVALLAEINMFPAYFVSQKRGYDSLALIHFPDAIFPPQLQTKVPEAMHDALEAGKCLAFEMCTAAGFHAFRAVESVVRRYYTQVANGKAPPRIRSLGVYIAAMERASVGDRKVLSALRHLNDLHRNPLIHPEATLSVDDAIAVLGLAQSVVVSMLAHLPQASLTTSA